MSGEGTTSPTRAGSPDRPRAWLSWSSGKDSAFALREVLRGGEVEVVGLLTTVSEAFGRVSMHGVREVLLDRQARSVGLPLTKVSIPYPCPNEVYERRMHEALGMAKRAGVDRVVFGDLFLEDIRAYREARMRAIGMECVFPLWRRPTEALAREMLGAGLRARLSCVDPRRIDRSFAGRPFDSELLSKLPAGTDPCGENGEFHTFVEALPGVLRRTVPVRVGEIVERDHFVFADLLPEEERPSAIGPVPASIGPESSVDADKR
jgi:uncharacterized protein (TIGR00290 family)